MPSSLPTLTIAAWSREDHPTILQDQSEEMTVTSQPPLSSSKTCGELISELKTKLKTLDRDLPADQVSTVMKHSTH